ncbi:putative DUF1887 family protein [Azospirillaceae bacterium]
MTLHIMFVSEQAMPSLIPSLLTKNNEDRFFPARHVLFIATQQMRQRAEWLSDALRPRGVSVEIYGIDGLANDFEKLRQILEDKFMEIDCRDPKKVVVNVTGGTKLMALMSFSIASALEWPIYYIDHQSDYILWLHNKNMPSIPITFEGNINVVMAAHGFTIASADRNPVAQNLRDLGEALIDRHAEFADILPTFNYLCMEAEAKLNANIPQRMMGRRGFQPLIQLFENAGLVKSLHGMTLCFPDEESRKIAAGGWLESYIYGKLYGLRGRQGNRALRDVATNVNIAGSNGARNEIDVAFLSGNHIGLIECKARGLVNGEPAFTQDAIHKLKSLRDAGGKQTYLYLCSYAPLSNAVVERANQDGVKIISGGRLANIHTLL